MNDYSDEEINIKAKSLFAGKVRDSSKGDFTEEQKIVAIKNAATEQIELALKDRLLDKIASATHKAYLEALSAQDESEYRYLWRQLGEIKDMERALVVLFRASKIKMID